MTKIVCSVYDTKACVFGQPFFMNTKGEAMRAFGDLVNDRQSLPSKHPKDFILFEIGSYSDTDAHLESLKAPVHLAVGSDFVLPEEKSN